MLQSVMEILFFFNPAVLWISKLIRTERENCCDDLAVAQDHNKVNYIRALVSCEEYKAFVPPYAMAFAGGRNTLLHRVKRMASNRNHSLNRLEKTILAVCLAGAGLFVMAFSAASTKPAPAQPAPAQHAAELPTATQHKQAPARKDTTVKPHPSESNIPQPLAVVQPVAADQPVAVVQPVAAAPAVSAPGDSLEADPYNSTGYDNRAYRSGYGRYADQQARYKSDEAKIKIDLMKEGLVSDTNHIHFTINEREFILNGVTQPPAVFQRYKDKFDPTNGPGWSWTHGTER
jgi:hypothetical protein